MPPKAKLPKPLPVKFRELKFPVGGLMKRYGYQSQPPYTTPDCCNVRPYDTILGRERGGSRPGIEKAYPQVMPFGGGSPIQMLKAISAIQNDGSVLRRLIAISLGQIFYDSFVGMTLSNSGTLNTTASLQAAELNGKLYIADTRANISGTNGVITDTNKLSTASFSDWKQLAISTSMDMVFVDNGVDAESKNYAITSIAGDGSYLTLSGTLTNATGCSFQVGRPVRVFDPTTPDTVSPLTETAGVAPLNCPLICVFRGRLLLSGPGPQLYMARIGDPTDWDYLADPSDQAKAFMFSDVQEDIAGALTESPTCVIPHTEDLLLISGENSLQVLHGDPGYGGQLEILSTQIGFLSANAWCKLPDSTILFLSRGGLFTVAPGASSYPQPYSRDIVPTSLLNVDVSANKVCMEYDVGSRGIHVYITPTSGAAGSHWWIDWTTKTLWLVTLPNAMQPMVAASYAIHAADPRYVILGCHDGYLRRYDETDIDDDGTDITSYVKIGPFPLGPSGFFGRIQQLSSFMGIGNDSVTCEIMAERTAEEAATSTTVRWTGTLAAGGSHQTYPRVSGNAASIKLSSTGQWAMEALNIQTVPAGRYR